MRGGDGCRGRTTESECMRKACLALIEDAVPLEYRGKRNLTKGQDQTGTRARRHARSLTKVAASDGRGLYPISTYPLRAERATKQGKEGEENNKIERDFVCQYCTVPSGPRLSPQAKSNLAWMAQCDQADRGLLNITA